MSFSDNFWELRKKKKKEEENAPKRDSLGNLSFNGAIAALDNDIAPVASSKLTVTSKSDISPLKEPIYKPGNILDVKTATKIIAGSPIKYGEITDTEKTAAKNNKIIAENTELLKNTPMDGTAHSVYDELQVIAKMEAGKEKRERKKAALKKLDELGVGASDYALYTDDSNVTAGGVLDFLGSAAMSGMAAFNDAFASTADVILGKPLQSLGWENNPISEWAGFTEEELERYRYNTNLFSEKMGKGEGNAWKIGGQVAEATVAGVPDALMAFFSGGSTYADDVVKFGTQYADDVVKLAGKAGKLLEKAGVTVKSMAKNPQFWLSFTKTYGNDYNEAKDNGASDTAAAFSSMISSLINAGIEVGVDGASGIQGLPEKVAKGGNSAILNWVESSLQEGTEETVQGVVSNIVAKTFYDEDRKIFDAKEMSANFGMGTAVGGLLGGGQVAVQGAVNAMQQHEANKLTENEEAVVNRVYEDEIAKAEKDGKKLTNSEKNKIREKVVEQMEKGYIDTDTIESVLGGDVYKMYKDSADKDAKTKAELENEIGQLVKTPEAQFTVEQRERLTELRGKLKELENDGTTQSWKETLDTEISQKLQNSRLVESYNEQTRRGETFKADISKYDKKQQAVIQKAIDSGILNNTNRTHDFVDMVAKISADKGVSFDFTDNEKLKTSGFALDGKSVNGYVTKDGVTLNIDSHKSLNSVVGHEITHVLEGTEFYTELQNTLFEYAKTKGEYDSRLNSLTELYKGVKDADVNAELTADLVGDYLFADSDFVTHLSTANRNVFQKLYDEVKYLYKVATAGSKEARELEKVKRAFDKAYKESGKAVADTKYSGSESKIINTLTGEELAVNTYKVLERLNKGEDVSPSEIESLKEVQEGVHRANEMRQRFVAENPDFANIPESDVGTYLLNDDERIQLRNEIIFKRLQEGSFTGVDKNGKEVYNGSVKRGKRIDIVIGLPASGKSSAIVNNLSQYYQSAVIDSDIIKRMLPEFNDGWGGMLVHEESSQINADLLDESMEIGNNIVLPIVGAKVSSVERYIELANVHGYNINIHLNELPNGKAVGRMLKRYFDDGRFINPTYVAAYGNAPTQVYEQIKQRGDISGYSRWNNDVAKGERPKLVEADESNRLYASYNGKSGQSGRAEIGRTDSQETRGEAETNQIAPIKKASSIDGVFFDEENDDTSYSVSADGEAPKRYGDYNVYGKDIKLEKAQTEEDVAPTQDKAISPFPSTTPKAYTMENSDVDTIDGYYGNKPIGPVVENAQKTAQSDTPVSRVNKTTSNEVVGDIAPTPPSAPTTAVTETAPVSREVFAGRVNEVYRKIKDLSSGKYHNVGDYGFHIVRAGDGHATITIKTPDGQKLQRKITEGKYWKNDKLWREAARMVAENQYPNVEQITVGEAKKAKIITDEPDAERPKRSLSMAARKNLVDEYSVFEDVALEKGNRELDAKANYMRYSEQMAQRFIGKGAKSEGVRAIKDVRAEVESAGLNTEFQDYMYNMLNTDRMSIEENATKVIERVSEKFKDLRPEQIHAIAAKEITEKTTERTAQTIKDAREYLWALDAKNLPVYGYDYTAEMSREAAAKYEAEHPEFKKWAQEVYDITNYLRDRLVRDGEISQETADLWAKIYPHYVPIRRVDKQGNAISVPLDTNKTGVNAPIKRATGGDSDIGDLWKTLALRSEQTFRAGAKNSFGVELMNTLGTRLDQQNTSLDADADSVYNRLETHEERLKKGEFGKNPTFTVFENGKRVEFEITEDMYDALKPKSEALSRTIPGLSHASKLHKKVLTEYNLAFSATNAIKDAQSVLVNSQHPVRTYAEFPRALGQLLTSKGEYVTEYMENGGESLTYFESDTKKFKKDDSAFKKIVGFPLKGISLVNNFVEKIPRLAEYIASRKAGASVEVAMLDAARVTTNFSAGGDVTRFANRNGVTFLNASVQGAAQQWRNAREAKAKGLKGVLGLVGRYAAAGLPAVLFNSLMWDDDEEYEELSDYVKDNYYVVAKFGDGEFVRIPKGREVAVIQKATELIEDVITGESEIGFTDIKDLGSLAMSNLAPNNPIKNNIIAPISQAIKNEAWYGGDIVPTRLQDVPAAEQFDESIDSISKWLGEKTNLSPYKINYLLDQYSGIVGDMFLPMLTPEAEGGGDTVGGKITAPIRDKFTTDSVTNNKIISNFYDIKDELTMNAKSVKATDEDILKYKYINSVNEEISELYKQQREIQNSNMTDSKKYIAVRDIQKQINELAENAIGESASVNIQGKYASVGDIHYRWYEPSKDSKSEAGWQKITEDQLKQQNKVTRGLGITPSDYWGNKEEYDFAYEKPEKYAVSKSVGGYTSYKRYTGEIYDIKGVDLDGDGRSDSGTRKEKVLEYLDNLDIDYYEKLILFKNEYNADDTYNYEIVDYLNGRDDISYEDTVIILKELGFDVDSKGNVTWD